jgi:photosystem II stability/assembly factor-like uncharacterized protein
MTALRDVEPGSKFTLPYSGHSGTVLYHSPAGTTVRYDGVRQVEITAVHGPVEFTAPTRPVVISGGTEVSQS